MISASTPGADNTERTETELALGHVYTVLGAYDLSDVKLVRIRNPWGLENYDGPWNDHDTSNWEKPTTVSGAAETYKKEFERLGLYSEDTGDGVFFIDHVTYHSNFYQT